MAQEITGSVESGALKKALEAVMRRRGRSILVASDGASFRQFEFGAGFVRASSAGPRAEVRIGHVFLEQGVLTQGELDGLRHFAHGDELKVEEFSVKHGFATFDQYSEALRAKLEEDLLDIFLWRNAEIRLLEHDPPDAFGNGEFQPGRLDVKVSRFLAKTLRAAEEMEDSGGRMPSGREVFERTRRHEALDDDDQWSPLLALLDGTRTIARALDQSGVRAVAAHRMLNHALKDGRVRRTPLRLARKVAHDHLVEEITELRQLLPRSPAPAIVRLRMARIFEAIGQPHHAAAQWKHLGRYWAQRGALERALEYYRNCVRLVPNDLATREAVIEIHRRTGDDRALAADGRPLAELFFKYNLPRRASVLLLKLVELEGNDIELRRHLCTVLIGLGAKGLALRHLTELARLLEDANVSAGDLRDVYIKILALDHRSERARSRLDTILGTTRQRRVAAASVVVASGLLIALSAWFGTEVVARRSLMEALDRGANLMEAHEFATAADLLEASYRRHRFSSKSGAAKMMGSRARRYADKMKRRMQEQVVETISTETRRAREAAAINARQAQETLAGGDIVEAHGLYQDLFERTPWADELQDAELPMHLEVLPADAKVFVDGELVSKGNTSLRYKPYGGNTLRVERSGFETREIPLDRCFELTMRVTLDRQILWMWEAGSSIDAPPFVATDAVYVGARDGWFTSLDLVSGRSSWHVPLGLYRDVAVQPVPLGDGLVVSTSDGDAVSVDPAARKVAWVRPIGAGGRGQPIRLKGGIVAVPAADGSISALDPEGTTVWTVPPGNVSAGDPARTPDGDLLFVDQAHALGRANGRTGAVVAEPGRAVGLRGTPVVGDAHTFVLAADRTLRVLLTESGREQARIALPYATRLDPVVEGDIAYLTAASGSEGYAMAFDTAGARVFGPVKLTDRPSARATVNRGRLYIPCEGGKLFVLDARTGDPLWSFDAGATITAPPVFDYGVAYVVTRKGTLFALAD